MTHKRLRYWVIEWTQGWSVSLRVFVCVCLCVEWQLIIQTSVYSVSEQVSDKQ